MKATKVRVFACASLLAAGCSDGPESDARYPTADSTLGNPSADPPPVVPTDDPNTPLDESQIPSPDPSGSAGPGMTAGPETPTVPTAPVDPGPVDPPPVIPASDCAIPPTSQVPRLLNREYDAAVRDLLGVETVEGREPSALLFTDLEGAITNSAWQAYLNVADAIAADVMAGPNRERFIDCDPADAACLETTITTFGRKAFRRPLSADEVSGFLSFASLEPAGTPDEIAEAILFAFLSSPSFLMAPELTEAVDADGGALALSSHEVATRLALLIWGSVPDDALNEAADDDLLREPARVWAEAQRMVGDREKAGPLLADFHRSYADITNTSHWDTLDHDATKYPSYSSREAVNPAMMAEIDAFFAEVALDGEFKDLFLSPVAYVNEATAPIYGLPVADFGPDLERVELDPTTRPGFLTRVGFLSSYSHFDSTAPILRGAYLSKHIIGVEVGPPNPDVLDTPPPEMEYTSNRQVAEVLTSPSDCALCHATIVNPPGFVLERYDAVGGIQIQDPLGGPIESTADVLFGSGVTKTITTPHELMSEIAKGFDARHLYAAKWVAYATKRVDHPDDACNVDYLTERLAGDGYRITDLLAEISQTEAFRLRTRGN